MDVLLVDGVFGAWTDWSACSETCGNGTVLRTRGCDSPEPQYGGANCTGDYSESAVCNLTPCPGKQAEKALIASTTPKNWSLSSTSFLCVILCAKCT